MGSAAADLLADWQQQMDEVQALEAIFGDDFRLLAADGLACSGSADQQDAAGSPLDATALASAEPPPCCSSEASSSSGSNAGWALDCSLLVRVDLHDGSVRLQLPDAGGVSQPDAVQAGCTGSSSSEPGGGAGSDAHPPCSSGRSSAGGYAVQYLPPICMQLRLGPGYPSQQPPEVSLSALWLSTSQAAQLELQLAGLWQEQGPGAPVCYTWADWLQSSTLQHLGAAGTLLLEGQPSSQLAGEQASRGSSGSSAAGMGSPATAAEAEEEVEETPEDRLLKLLRYNALEEHRTFAEGLHTCGVCLEEQRGTAFVRLDCRHAWCHGCLAAAARIHVAEGSIEMIKCPDPQCGAPLSPAVLQRVLSPDDFSRWEQLTLQRTLDTMPDAAYCPRCSTLSLEDEDSCAQCPKCLFVFCSLCNEGWHPGTQCVSAETKLAMLRRKMEGGSRAAIEDLRRQEQDLLSLAQIEKMAKKCPRCGMATQKAEGCNKMSCGGCGAYWCWRCGKEIDGYRHFRSGECILFDEAEILRWEAQWEEMQAAARVMAAGMRNEFVGETATRQGRRPRGCFCPNCGQLNHKMGNNNHMSCWSCTSHFCYLCRTVLRGKGAGGSHFGPRGCKQHSAD